MPSIGYRPLKYKNRYVLLRELNYKRQQREALFNAFEKALAPFLPRPKRQPPGPDHTTTTLQHRTSLKTKLRFNQLLYELRRDGLVVGASRQGALIEITGRGLRLLRMLRDKPPVSPPSYTERAPKSDHFTIVTYDLPNRLNSLRNWLRRSLRSCGMTALQRSVFVGKIKIPAPLLRSIVELKLEKHVEVFEITKTGTLRELSYSLS
jgi:CRISPR/Cas system-associated endoribonuclease Cas2